MSEQLRERVKERKRESERKKERDREGRQTVAKTSLSLMHHNEKFMYLKFAALNFETCYLFYALDAAVGGV